MSIVSALIDDCNSLLYGISQCNFDRLQRVQNSFARVLIQASRRSSATELRQQLRCLPIRKHVSFKLRTITFRTISTGTRLTSRVSCINTNRWGHCALAPLLGLHAPASCVFWLPPTLLCSLCVGYLAGTIYLLPSAILAPWTPSKLLSSQNSISSTPPTRHATDSDSHRRLLFTLLWHMGSTKEIRLDWLIDWLIDDNTWS